ncbi:MAG: pyruvate, phosphate dikinase, partial [Candidatus Nealsonbacteria bacterium]|nr:pyruvate, phosphate dikinase [Candidatus Nealsonbacteria bacterium]
MPKYVYSFGPKGTDGDATMRDELGGKGANLAEMAKLNLPVPAGFTITTGCCVDFLAEGGKFPAGLDDEIAKALKLTEAAMGMKYGDPENPLLVSSRSGSRESMPGMMETVLNVGLCSTTIPGLVKKSGSERFVYDAYRRLITMYSDVVMEKAEDVEPKEGQGIRQHLEKLMDAVKESKGYAEDTDLTAADLKPLCEAYKAKVKEILGCEFPDDAMDQLRGSISAVFKSWNGKRAVSYRRIESIPDAWGTAVNVQSMVFGNMGDTSATGVAFSRNPATGENKFYGEWLINAQGEDVVAGIRTPSPLNEETKNEQNKHLKSLEKEWAALYEELFDIRNNLEKHFTDMQDIEFTIQDGKLYMLQCRSGKRTGTAALNMAMDMLAEGLIDEETAVMRVQPAQLDELLHPIIDPAAEKKAEAFVSGLPAGPGGACGEIVFTSSDAVAAQRDGRTCLLVREETNPEDVEGMRAAEGILTARGGMTSHAALVARGWGKCCIVGAGDLKIDAASKSMTVGGQTFKAGDVLTLNGTKGKVYSGELTMMDATENPRFQEFMKLADKHRTMGVRTNADTPEDAKIARDFGAEGIGLFRTEHMFYGVGTEQALFVLRKMIHAGSDEERNAAIDELAPFVKRDIKATLEAMDGMPVTVRLLDPPLHEFVPQAEAALKELAEALGISVDEVKKRGSDLHEVNPMMGHRGVRLGITYPYLTEMQIRAILEGAAELKKDGKDPHPEVMVPVTCTVKELDFVKPIFDRVMAEVKQQSGVEVGCLYGTMIEIPRAALCADKMAVTAEFFSFGTNDLTQTTLGISRDDSADFLPYYLEHDIVKSEPFQSIDIEGVGKLME